MEYLPEYGTPYLVTESELQVGNTPPADPFKDVLRAASVLEVRVVDQETGAGLPDVDLWRQD